MEKLDQSRRRFLKGVAFIGSCGFLLWKFLFPSSSAKSKTLLKVKKVEIPLHGALVYRHSRVAVIKSEEDIYALSLVCTHLGCTVNVTSKKMTCPCHGSIFNLQGEVLKGPADRSLPRLEIEDRGETVVVKA